MEAKRTIVRARVMNWFASTRRTRLVIAVLTLLSALAISNAGVASASTLWQTEDSFETNPASTWVLYHSAIGSGGFDLSAGTARTGNNDSWLSVQTGFSSVGRTVHLSPATLHQVTCAAGIYVQPLGTTQLNFEVIDPNTWTYVALKTVTLTGGSYKSVLSGSFVPPSPDVFVRVSLLGNGNFTAARVDDLAVQCVY